MLCVRVCVVWVNRTHMSAVAERGVVAQLKEEVVEDDGVLAHHGREEETVAYKCCSVAEWVREREGTRGVSSGATR